MLVTRLPARADPADPVQPADRAADPLVTPAGIGAPGWRDLLRSRSVRWMLALMLGSSAVLAYGLATLRANALAGEYRVLASLAAAMAAQADATLDAADTALRATRAELGDGLIVPGSARATELLRTRASSMPKFHALAVLDAAGERVATSRVDEGPTPNAAGRDFFVAARDSATPTLQISPTFQSHADGRASIALAMDWRDAVGAFKGVVLLVAGPGFLDGGFERVAPAPDARLAIYRRDGSLLSQSPSHEANALLPPDLVAGAWSQEPPRELELPGGAERLLAVQALREAPLMMTISRDTRRVLAPWRAQAWLASLGLAAGLLALGVLTWRHAREQHLRQASQAALAAEQGRAMRAFHAAQEGNWEYDMRRGEMSLSPRMKELHGLVRDTPLAGRVDSLWRANLHPDDDLRLSEAVDAHVKGRSDRFDITYRVRWADGRWRHVRSRGQIERDATGAPLRFSGAASDVTPEVEARAHAQALEMQLQQSHRLESLGRLAGGIAHDFNNVLAAVIGYGEMARQGAADGTPQARHLDQVTQAGQRGKALVDRILAFSRGGGVRAHVSLRLQPVIEEVIDLLGAGLPAAVRLERRLQAPAACIKGDATLLFEAAMNLCTNAVQAMPHGGTLGIELDERQVETPLALSQQTLGPGGYARLRVVDTGPGIDPAVLTRLFEPFFTTRGSQGGTGLGLAVVHGVVADLGGALDVHTRLGQGSAFTLYFPLVAPVADAPLEIAAASPPGQGQTILVVDDERALVELAEELLAGLGYEPLGFVSAAAALAAFETDPDRFDLVVTDQQMPAMTGLELTQALHRLRPALPVLLTSGYGGSHCTEQAGAGGVVAVLKKPLARAELARAVADALAGRTPAIGSPTLRT